MVSAYQGFIKKTSMYITSESCPCMLCFVRWICMCVMHVEKESGSDREGEREIRWDCVI